MRGKAQLCFLVLVVFASASAFNVFAKEVTVADIASLRQALTDAQNNQEDDTIHILPGTYRLDAPLIYFAPDPVDGNEPYSLTITGAGSDQTIFEAEGLKSLLDIDTLNVDSHYPITVSVSGCTFRNALFCALSVTGKKAAITLSGCVFNKNTGGATLITFSGPITISG